MGETGIAIHVIKLVEHVIMVINIIVIVVAQIVIKSIIIATVMLVIIKLNPLYVIDVTVLVKRVMEEAIEIVFLVLVLESLRIVYVKFLVHQIIIYTVPMFVDLAILNVITVKDHHLNNVQSAQEVILKINNVFLLVNLFIIQATIHA